MEKAHEAPSVNPQNRTTTHTHSPPPMDCQKGCSSEALFPLDWCPATASLPSVGIPVAIYVAPACAAWCRTLKNIFMHGKNLTRRVRENSRV